MYCLNEKIISLNEIEVGLTDYGKSFSRFRGWYQMLIGGYGNTFLQIGSCLFRDTDSATRDGKQVGVGSCAISHFDALPLTQKLLSLSTRDYKLALDIGCGNAQYLIEFCRYFPNINAVGVEPDKSGFVAAKELVEAQGFSRQITLVNATALDFFSTTLIEPDLVIISFVLHEILGQSSDQVVKSFLQSIIARYPNIDIVIIEVDNQIQTPEIMQKDLSLGYYNPYYLLHYFTNQRLETDSYWTNLFEECNLEIIGKDYPNDNIDSTKLEIGYLLRANHVKNNEY